MNVRFFAGTKSEYLGLAKHNPIALYFCSDTRELFWGDRLLSDGIRIIPTKKDLPELDAAADGIIYYVVDCRNGYVLSQDRTSWVQVIYAPAASVSEVPEGEAGNTAVSVTAIREIENTIYEKIASIENLNKIKTISFAGVALDRADGVFSIERDTARKALGFIVPEGLEAEEIAIATEDFVKSEIAKAEFGEVEINLENYYTKDQTDKAIADAISGIEAPEADLSSYATKEELSAAIDSIEHPIVDLTGYATEHWVSEQGFLKEHQDLSEYAKKSEVPSIDGLASESYVDEKVKSMVIPEVPTKVSELENDAKYATEEYVDNAISNIEVPTKVSELENDVKYITKNIYTYNINSNFYSEEDVDLTDELVEFANRFIANEPVSLQVNFQGKVYPTTVEYVSAFKRLRITFVDIITSSKYYNNGEDYQKIGTILCEYSLTCHRNASNTAWESAKYSRVTDVNENSGEVLPSHETVQDMINRAVSNIEHPTKVSELENDAGYITAADIPEVDLSNYYNKSETEALVNEAINGIDIPDTSSFITMEDVEDKGYLTEHQDLSEYAKKSEIPSVEGLASEDFVRSEIAKAELNGGEVTEEELDNLLANYYNKTEVDNKFKEFEIPSIEGLATEEFVNNAIAGIEIPEAEIYKVDFNAPNYAEAVEAYNNGKVLVLINAAPDVNSYAIMNYVRDDIISFTKFLMSRSGTYGSFNTYYLHNDGTWELAKEVKLNKVEITNDGDLQVGKQTLEIPSVEGFATEEYVDSKIGEIKLPEAELFIVDFAAPDFTAAINAYNNGKFLVLANAAPDANGYAIMNYVRDDTITFTKFLTSRSEAYGAFNTYYLHSDNSWELSKEVLLNKVEANVEGEVNGELTSIRIGKEIYSIPSIAGLASTEYVDNAISAIPEVDLADYATKAEIPSLEGYAKVTDIPDVSKFITEVPSEYVTETELTSKGFITEHQDLSHLAEKDHTHDDYAEKDHEHDQYLTEHQSLEAYAKKEELFSGSYNDLTDKPEIPSVDGLASTEYVDNAIAGIEIPEPEKVDLTGYAKLTDIPDVSKFIEEVPAEYITEDELNDKGYITSLAGYATEAYVSQQIEAIDLSEYAKTVDIPTDYLTDADLEGYSKFSGSYNDLTDKPEIPSVDGLLEQLNAKANDVVFTESKIVATAIGGFTVGEDVNGLTVAQLFAKLLGLSDSPGEDPNEPDVPVEPTGIIETILAKEYPLYQMSDSGNLVEIPYSYISLTEDSAKTKPTDPAFFCIESIDGTKVYGYQQLSANNIDIPYMIALPSIIDFDTNVTIQKYDDGMLKAWTPENDIKRTMISNEEEINALCADLEISVPDIPDDYTLWVSTEYSNDESMYRLIITESEVD